MFNFDLNEVLLVTNVLTGLLFVFSEVIGYSKCSSNGVFQFLLKLPCGNEEVEIRHTPLA